MFNAIRLAAKPNTEHNPKALDSFSIETANKKQTLNMISRNYY